MKFWCALWKLLDLDKWQWEMELFRAFWEIYHVAEVVLIMAKSQTPRQMWPDGAIGHRSHLNLFVRISMDILQNISVDFDWYTWWQQLICWYLDFLTQIRDFLAYFDISSWEVLYFATAAVECTRCFRSWWIAKKNIGTRWFQCRYIPSINYPRYHMSKG